MNQRIEAEWLPEDWSRAWPIGSVAELQATFPTQWDVRPVPPPLPDGEVDPAWWEPLQKEAAVVLIQEQATRDYYAVIVPLPNHENRPISWQEYEPWNERYPEGDEEEEEEEEEVSWDATPSDWPTFAAEYPAQMAQDGIAVEAEIQLPTWNPLDSTMPIGSLPIPQMSWWNADAQEEARWVLSQYLTFTPLVEVESNDVRMRIPRPAGPWVAAGRLQNHTAWEAARTFPLFAPVLAAIAHGLYRDTNAGLEIWVPREWWIESALRSLQAFAPQDAGVPDRERYPVFEIRMPEVATILDWWIDQMDQNEAAGHPWQSAPLQFTPTSRLEPELGTLSYPTYQAWRQALQRQSWVWTPRVRRWGRRQVILG